MKKIVILILSCYLLSNVVFARAGGGTSSSSHSTNTHTSTYGNSSTNSSLGNILFFGFIAVFLGLGRQFGIKGILKARKDLKQAALSDSSWDIKKLKEITKKTFMAYQDARSQKDLEPIKILFFKDFYDYSKQKMENDLMGRKNIIENPYIKLMLLMEILDTQGSDFDIFVMQIQANLREKYVYEDTLENVKAGFSRTKRHIQFTEYWSFIRINGNWLLFDISERYIPIKTLTEKFKNRNLQENQKL